MDTIEQKIMFLMFLRSRRKINKGVFEPMVHVDVKVLYSAEYFNIPEHWVVRNLSPVIIPFNFTEIIIN